MAAHPCPECKGTGWQNVQVEPDFIMDVLLPLVTREFALGRSGGSYLVHPEDPGFFVSSLGTEIHTPMGTVRLIADSTVPRKTAQVAK